MTAFGGDAAFSEGRNLAQSRRRTFGRQANVTHIGARYAARPQGNVLYLSLSEKRHSEKPPYRLRLGRLRVRLNRVLGVQLGLHLRIDANADDGPMPVGGRPIFFSACRGLRSTKLPRDRWGHVLFSRKAKSTCPRSDREF